MLPVTVQGRFGCGIGGEGGMRRQFVDVDEPRIGNLGKAVLLFLASALPDSDRTADKNSVMFFMFGVFIDYLF